MTTLCPSCGKEIEEGGLDCMYCNSKSPLGWLFAVALVLVAGPFLLLVSICSNPLFMQEPYYCLTGSDNILLFKLITDLAFLVGIVYLNILFFRRKKTFPMRLIVFLILVFLTSLYEYHEWSNSVFPNEVCEGVLVHLMKLRQEIILRLMSSSIAGISWIWIFLRSQRVEKRFVK